MEDLLRAALSFESEPEPHPEIRHAAVSIILSGPEQEVLFIRRAERPDDPWSGQIGLPGGRQEPSDDSLLQTAIRETREEVALRLQPEDCLGQLPRIQARSRAGLLNLWVTPFVFHQPSTRPATTPNYEVAEVLWLPINSLLSEENQSEVLMPRGDVRLRLPAWKVSGQVIWGLTHAIVSELLQHLPGA